MTANDIANVARSVIRFQPHSLRIERDSLKFKGWEDFQSRVAQRRDVSSIFHLTSKDENCDFGLSYIPGWGISALNWSQPDFQEEEVAVIESMMGLDFHTGVSRDRSTIILSEAIDEEDRRKWPGRQRGFSGMWISAGWRNWYGPWASKHLSLSRIKNFSPAYEIRELPGGGLYIALTRDPYDPELPRIQAKFWLDTGLSELEAFSFQKA